MQICLMPLKIVPGNPVENIRQFVEQLDQVRQQHPDLICLPECSFSGYLYAEPDFTRCAEPIPGPTTAEMSRLARIHDTYICFGLLESTAQGVYDSAVLLDRSGAIAGVHRKITEKPPFVNGSTVRSLVTEIGRLGILICADLFNDQVINQLDPGLQLLLVPMWRSFDGQSPDGQRWEKDERQVYLDAVRQAAVPTVMVNALEISATESSFGGALVVSARGELLAESPHGTDEILIYDFD
jgi:predicted amidohydrolase